VSGIHASGGRSVALNRAGAWVFLAVALCTVLVVQAPPSVKAAEGFRPCEGGQVKADEGHAELGISRNMRKRLARRGLGVTLVEPAGFSGGQPTYPVRTASDKGGLITARLAGGFRVSGDRKRRVRVRLTRFIHDGRSRKVIRGLVRWSRGSREMALFRIRGGTVTRNPEAKRFTLDGGRVRLTPAFAKALRRHAGLRPARAGQLWGKLLLTRAPLSVYEAKPPLEAGPFPEPEGADTLTGGSFIWEVRKSWVDYLGAGRTTAVGGASPVSGSIYRFTFPFEQGWVKRGDGGAIESASLEASGGVYFRACGNQSAYLGINFQTRDPEFRFEGGSARLVLTVQGIDQTPFPASRAVVVELTPKEPGKGTGGMYWIGKVAPGAYGLFSRLYRPGTSYGDAFGFADVTVEWSGGSFEWGGED